MVVVDPRTSFARDRTWCFWNVRPQPYADAVTHRWSRWRVAGPDGATVERASRRYSYHHVPSDAFYAAALARIAAAPHVELRLGERVDAVEDATDGVRVHTTRGTLRAGRVFDSRPAGQPGTGQHASPAHASSRYPPRLAQSFVGAVVRTAAPDFDRDAVTLMDFTAEWDGEGFAFGYVLPYSRQDALVELAVIAPEPPPATALDAAFARYAARLAGGAGYAVRSRERGVIAMDAARPARRPSPRVTRIGVAGGMAKPSTGYAFLAIQQDALALARALGRGTPPEAGAREARGPVARWLDHVFLRRLRADPAAAPALFTRLFAAAEPDALVRFLSDAASPADVARIVAALPTLPFVAEAVRMVA